MIANDRTYGDNTILKSAASCSMQLVLRHVLGWNTNNAAAPLRAGNAGHVVLAAAHKGETEWLPIFEAEYKAYADEHVLLDDRLAYANLATILDEWLVARFPGVPWAVTDPRMVEVGFAYPLDDTGTRVFFGRMDAIGRDRRTGDWVVVDHKTTGRLDATWVELWGLDSQLTGYFWAALQHVPNLRGFYVNGIEFSKLPNSDRKCTAHGLPYYQCQRMHMRAEIVGPVTRTPEQVEKWRVDAIRLIDKYTFYARAYDPAVVGTTPDLSNVEMEGPFTNTCRFCQFRDFCRLGQRPEMLPALFIQDPWQPYDPRQFESAPGLE